MNIYITWNNVDFLIQPHKFDKSLPCGESFKHTTVVIDTHRSDKKFSPMRNLSNIQMMQGWDYFIIIDQSDNSPPSYSRYFPEILLTGINCKNTYFIHTINKSHLCTSLARIQPFHFKQNPFALHCHHTSYEYISVQIFFSEIHHFFLFFNNSRGCHCHYGYLGFIQVYP